MNWPIRFRSSAPRSCTPIRPMNPCSAAKHLTDLRYRSRRFQAPERLHPGVAEPRRRLPGVVDADQAGLVAAAAVVAEGQRLAVRQLRPGACGEPFRVALDAADHDELAV